ncbi:Glycine cleavage system transcriptional repressor [Posidoniimonas corsicana]|uniref:Glycine cleavage system transcriptional repressor n=1 Tax=Posidoniimonas corsicana TaxID=1938618 RepID=A0A5C5UVQ1_9BACT|nr:ACT domain-containing protein [Posidoniimonas corsicana]TWT30238.1 Glycine cleavage system transcriptional repressor [Posidoniimonas corsicana]
MSTNVTSLVLTILGQDRPGLVESIAQLVADHGGNWLESRMAHLAGQFAGILRVEVPEDQAENLTAALRTLSDRGLESVVQTDGTSAPALPTPLVLLDVMGQDRAGIIREISRVLAASGVNVEELSTERTAAANTGQLLFQAKARLRMPPGVDEVQLREALEAVAADLMVDVSLAGEE